MPNGTMRPVAIRAFIAAAGVVLCLLLSDAATSQPLDAAPVRPRDGYEEAFGPALCRDFDFLLHSETAARFEQDRLVIRPTSAYHPSGSCLMPVLSPR